MLGIELGSWGEQTDIVLLERIYFIFNNVYVCIWECTCVHAVACGVQKEMSASPELEFHCELPDVGAGY